MIYRNEYNVEEFDNLNNNGFSSKKKKFTIIVNPIGRNGIAFPTIEYRAQIKALDIVNNIPKDLVHKVDIDIKPYPDGRDFALIKKHSYRINVLHPRTDLYELMKKAEWQDLLNIGNVKPLQWLVYYDDVTGLRSVLENGGTQHHTGAIGRLHGLDEVVDPRLEGRVRELGSGHRLRGHPQPGVTDVQDREDRQFRPRGSWAPSRRSP